MTPSQQAKSVGLKSLTQVSQLTGVSLNTLTNWHRGKPELFRLVLLGCLADELSDTPVVVRWFGDFWGICHAKSYQSAFRRSVNRFATRGEAVEFAEDHNCAVEKHEHDRLQDYI